MVSLELLGVTTIIFGIAALVLASRARRRLTPGSLREYIDYFSICLVFIVIFSLWQTARILLDFKLTLGGLTEYPEYIFIVFAYVAFIFTSYRVTKISTEFGFLEEGKDIHKAMKRKKKK